MEALVTVVLTLGVAVIVFLIGRSLVLWYWKVNQIISLLESIDRKLPAQPVPPRSIWAPSVNAPAEPDARPRAPLPL